MHLGHTIFSWRGAERGEAMLDLHRFAPVCTDLLQFAPCNIELRAKGLSAGSLEGGLGCFGGGTATPNDGFRVKLSRRGAGGAGSRRGGRCCGGENRERAAVTRAWGHRGRGHRDRGQWGQRDPEHSPTPRTELPAPLASPARYPPPDGPRSAAEPSGCESGKLRQGELSCGLMLEVPAGSFVRESTEPWGGWSCSRRMKGMLGHAAHVAVAYS